jgi:hypothetical protein
MGQQLDRIALLQKEKLHVEKVEFEDGNFVYVSEMTGHGRDVFENSLIRKGKDDKGNITFEQITEEFRAKLAVCTLCDAEGNMLLNKEDYLKLSNAIGAKKLEKIVNAAQRINAITEEDKAALVKNLKPDLEDVSNSSSVEH